MSFVNLLQSHVKDRFNFALLCDINVRCDSHGFDLLKGIRIKYIYVREAFNKKKNKLCGNFPQGGGGFEPDPHFFEKNKVGLKMCFKSF